MALPRLCPCADPPEELFAALVEHAVACEHAPSALVHSEARVGAELCSTAVERMHGGVGDGRCRGHPPDDDELMREHRGGVGVSHARRRLAVSRVHLPPDAAAEVEGVEIGEGAVGAVDPAVDEEMVARGR